MKTLSLSGIIRFAWPILFCLILLTLNYIVEVSAKEFSESRRQPTTTISPFIPPSPTAASPVPTRAVHAILTPTPSASEIEIYKEIAQTAINASKDALEQMKWVIATFAVILIGIASGIVTFFINNQREVNNSAEKTRNDLRLATENLQAAERQLSRLSSSYFMREQELLDQITRYISLDMAYELYERGDLNAKELLEAQIWFAWANWYYLEKEEAYFQLEAYRDNSDGLPLSIRRLILLEYDRLNYSTQKRGMIYLQEKDRLKKLLSLIKLAPISENDFAPTTMSD